MLTPLESSSPIIGKDVLVAEVTGNNFTNSLHGTMSDDLIQENGGSDNLFGIAGNDEISCGTGTDFIQV